MKRLILLVFLGIAPTAFAQITITASQFLTGFTSGQATGKVYTSTDLSGVPALIAAAGANQSWDFGGRVYTEEPTAGAFLQVFAFPGTAPFANDPDFAPSTHVIKVALSDTSLNATYLYVRFTDQGYWTVGMAYDSMGTPKKLDVYDPPKQEYAFPLTYQTEWHSNSQLKNPLYPAEVTRTEKVDAVVDGYGTLIVPTRAGKEDHSPASSNQALRIESKTESKTDYIVFAFSTTTYSYEWMTLSQYGATISADSAKTPQSIGYSTPGSSGAVDATPGNAMEIKLSANPAIAETAVSFTLEQPATIHISVLDVLGNSVQNVTGPGHEGENVVPLSVQTLPSGTYFLRLDAGDLRTIKKLVVRR